MCPSCAYAHDLDSTLGAANITTGIIKWVNEAKGIGLLTPDSGGKDIFARFTPLRAGDKSRFFMVKQKVSFDITAGPDGDLALNVKPLM